MIYDEKILLILAHRWGMTTSDVAARVRPLFGHSSRTHSSYIRSRLLDLEKRGLVKRLDNEKPVCWQRTQP